MTNPYEQLRAEINKRFPERLKLEFGVEVEMLCGDMHGYIGRVIWDGGRCKKHKTQRGCVNNDELCDIEECTRVVTGFDGNIYSETIEWNLLPTDYKILGKPLSIADVLEVVRQKYMEGTLQYEGEFKNFWEWCGEIVDLFETPLTTPLSHPDNSVACEKLLALLTNKGI